MRKPVVVGLIGASLALGCGSSGDEPFSDVTVEFAAVVDGEPFVCGDTYENLGSDDTSLELTDFRFYVQDIELRNSSGEYVPVELTENDWQVGQTVLIDFEDRCSNSGLGNPEVNNLATGAAAGGPFTGIRFQMGIPFTENHSNPATAPPPLNLDTMHWNWQGGYKFLRIDSGNFDMTSWRMHLGSTGCDGDPLSGGTTMCATSNRVDVELDFDPTSDVVVADFARLVEGAPLSENQEGTPVGCMAGPGDSDCGPLFDNLGLAFGGEEPSGDQIFFSVETP
jgi:uncharacterized repeat protein (TIGR04052 family)